MASNKKITELTELTEIDLSDDDVLPIVDVSAGTTNKVRKSTLASALAGVASMSATSPVAVNQATGAVTVSLDTVPITSGGTGAVTADDARNNLGAALDPTDTRGDLITRGITTLDKLAIGSNNYVLKSNGTDPVWGQVDGGEVTGTVAVVNGGTGSTTSSGALTNLGAAASGANTDITSLAADLVISGSTSGDALRITQTGSGNALKVEDSANPDSTPFVVDASGKVGIATTSPAQELHVVGKTRIQRSTNANLEITSDNNTGVNPFVVGSNSDTFYIKNQAASGFGTGGDFIQYSESGSLSLMGTNYIDSSGNVGIGTSSPDFLLDVAGRIGILEGTNGIAFHDGAGSVSAGVRADSGDNLIFATGSSDTERLRIESDGGVKVVNAAYNPITTDNDLSFDQSASNNFKCTPSGTGTLTFTNHTDGQTGNVLLINTGGHAISLAATTKGDANLATTISAAGTYWLSYYDDGTNAYVVTSAVFA